MSAREDNTAAGTVADGGKPVALLVAVGIVVAAVVAFILQNGEKAKVTWLFFDATAPVWLVIVIAGAAGGLLTKLVSFIAKHYPSERHHKTDKHFKSE